MAAEAARLEGNAHYKAQRYVQAVEAYSRGIEASPRDPVLLGNRAAALFAMGQMERSLADSQLSAEIKPDYDKSFFRAGRCLMALGRADDAAASFASAARLAPSVAEYQQALLEAQLLGEGAYYAKLTSNYDDNVQVRLLDRPSGKGLFAKRSFSAGETLFREVPLLWHREVGDEGRDELQVCGHCLKTVSQRTDYGDKGAAFDAQFSGAPAPAMVTCPRECQLEQYCSESCRDTAWKSYHEVLCPGDIMKATAIHPILALDHMSRRLKRTNPMAIARAFAMIKTWLDNGIRPEAVLLPFMRFVHYEPKNAGDKDALSILTRIFESDPRMSSIVTLSNYRKINGAMLRNAQNIHPVSALFSLLTGAPNDSRTRVMQALGVTDDGIPQTVQAEWMQMLTAHGTGLFPVANCMNHSCAPNIASVTRAPDYSLELVATRPIEKGEEMFISYIDEMLPREERRRLLKESYLFDCECEKCGKL